MTISSLTLSEKTTEPCATENLLAGEWVRVLVLQPGGQPHLRARLKLNALLPTGSPLPNPKPTASPSPSNCGTACSGFALTAVRLPGRRVAVVKLVPRLRATTGTATPVKMIVWKKACVAESPTAGASCGRTTCTKPRPGSASPKPTARPINPKRQVGVVRE